jgi:hypothetical protein
VIASSPAGVAGTSVVTVDTSSATSNGAAFLYINTPTLTGLSPTSGSIVGGNNVTLIGTGFITATAVAFGAIPATFSILSDTVLSAVAPSGTGAVPVIVASPGGKTGSHAYTYS